MAFAGYQLHLGNEPAPWQMDSDKPNTNIRDMNSYIIHVCRLRVPGVEVEQHFLICDSD